MSRETGKTREEEEEEDTKDKREEEEVKLIEAFPDRAVGSSHLLCLFGLVHLDSH